MKPAPVDLSAFGLPQHISTVTHHTLSDSPKHRLNLPNLIQRLLLWLNIDILPPRLFPLSIRLVVLSRRTDRAHAGGGSLALAFCGGDLFGGG